MKKRTPKLKGDTGEYFVLWMLSRIGNYTVIPMPVNWAGYDLTARTPTGAKTIQVKATETWDDAFLAQYWTYNEFDYLAIVIDADGRYKTPRAWLLPRGTADQLARKPKPSAKDQSCRYFNYADVLDGGVLVPFENNWSLN